MRGTGRSVRGEPSSPRAASTPTTAAAGETTREPARPRTRRRGGDGARGGHREPVDRVREGDGGEGALPAVPGRLGQLAVQPGEGPGPPFGGAEHDGIGEVLREQVLLLG